MGQKVYPTGFRLGITENWRSRWFAEKDYAKTLGNDLEIRKYLEKRLSRAAVSRVEIERAGDKVKVIILTARPGVVIGKKGAEIDTLRTELEKVAGVSKGQLSVDVVEIKRPELDANLVAQSIAEQLEGRVVSAVPRWAVVSGTARVACLCTPSVPRSTTARLSPAPPWALAA